MSAYKHDEIESILKKYGDMIYRTAYIQVKYREYAEDIYQEVCIKLLKQEVRIEPEEHLKAWLLKVTINSCKDFFKSAWQRKVVFTAFHIDKNYGNKIRDEDGIGKITEFVQALPEKYRIIIHLYYYEEYSQKEIAQILGIKENTVASRLLRGRNKLKKMLEKEKGDFYEF